LSHACYQFPVVPDRTNPRYAWRIATALALLCLAWPNSAAAHPPYEHPERVVTDKDGRTLHLVKSYVDGIFFTDPVKLVVRDADDRMVAETEYGRDLSVLCWRSRPCVVFRYDGLTPVVPTNIWRLEGGELRDARSAALLALGIVAPLWDHAGGYAFSIVSLAVPLLVLWLLIRSADSRRRTLLLTITGLASIPYVVMWLYSVTLLSYLSLPLVVVVGATAGGGVFLARRALLKAGVAESSLVGAARVAGWIIAGAAGFGVVALGALFVRMALYSSSISFEEPQVHTPLAKARITRVKGVTNEVFATVADGVKLEDVVNLDIFAGFDPAMTREEAELRLGQPSGRWTDPVYKLAAGYYDRVGGRVSLVRQGASEWSTIGHPSSCTHEYVFRDSRLREQLLQWLPPKDVVQVNVLRNVGWGGLTVFLSRDACTYLVLTARDGDPESR
jgi:hypothetical protein